MSREFQMEVRNAEMMGRVHTSPMRMVLGDGRPFAPWLNRRLWLCLAVLEAKLSSPESATQQEGLK